MDSALSPALEEAENEDWAATYTQLRGRVEELRTAFPDIGESLVDALRETFRCGWFRRYLREIEERQP